jgi:hypothetical protein
VLSFKDEIRSGRTYYSADPGLSHHFRIDYCEKSICVYSKIIGIYNMILDSSAANIYLVFVTDFVYRTIAPENEKYKKKQLSLPSLFLLFAHRNLSSTYSEYIIYLVKRIFRNNSLYFPLHVGIEMTSQADNFIVHRQWLPVYVHCFNDAQRFNEVVPKFFSHFCE